MVLWYVYIDHDVDEDIKPLVSDHPNREEVDDYNKYVGDTFILDPIDNSANVGTKARVMQCQMDPFGNPIGTVHKNPILDMQEYDIMLEDGTCDVYCANTIAENLWSQCDAEGKEIQ